MNNPVKIWIEQEQIHLQDKDPCSLHVWNSDKVSQLAIMSLKMREL